MVDGEIRAAARSIQGSGDSEDEQSWLVKLCRAGRVDSMTLRTLALLGSRAAQNITEFGSQTSLAGGVCSPSSRYWSQWKAHFKQAGRKQCCWVAFVAARAVLPAEGSLSSLWVAIEDFCRNGSRVSRDSIDSLMTKRGRRQVARWSSITPAFYAGRCCLDKNFWAFGQKALLAAYATFDGSADEFSILVLRLAAEELVQRE